MNKSETNQLALDCLLLTVENTDSVYADSLQKFAHKVIAKQLGEIKDLNQALIKSIEADIEAASDDLNTAGEDFFEKHPHFIKAISDLTAWITKQERAINP
jgi:hypothetical protein